MADHTGDHHTGDRPRGRRLRAAAIAGATLLALASGAALVGVATLDGAQRPAAAQGGEPAQQKPSPAPTRAEASPSGTPSASFSPTPGAPSPSGNPATIVSLTFDDGRANQAGAAEVLASRGLTATYYVNSGTVGSTGFLTRGQLETLAKQGNEIGGHTVTHPDLTAAPGVEAQRQICQDRESLSRWGFTVRSFAYPFAAVDDAARKAVIECGYSSARGLGDLLSPASCFECDAGEGRPPRDPYLTRAPEQVTSDWTLAHFQSLVRAAQREGRGWVQLTFHDFDTGAELSVSRATFGALADWLAAEQRRGALGVRTVGDAVGGGAKPLVPAAGARPEPPGPGENGVVNGGFEELSDTGQPACWWQSTSGANTSDFSVVKGLRGERAARVGVSAHHSGDGKWLQNLDLGSCSPTVQAGHAYSLRSAYTSSEVTQFAVYLRSEAGAWSYWTSSPWFSASEGPAEASWQTPPVPAGYTGMSFGLNAFRDGSLVVDDVRLYDAAGAPPTD